MADADYTNERWLPVPGYEGHYEVSDMGRVRSLDRVLPMNGSKGRRYKGRMLKPSNAGHPHVALVHPDLGIRTWTIHRLVMLAFVGPLPEGLTTRHLNDDKCDNRLSNLAYGTYSENMLDRVRNGIHHQSVKTVCKEGHPLTAQNTYRYPDGRRECRTCRARQVREFQERRRGISDAA